MCSKLGFPGGSDGKDSACNAGDASSVPGLERSPQEGNGNPFQYSCLGNSINREAWQAAVPGVTGTMTLVVNTGWLTQGVFYGG